MSRRAAIPLLTLALSAGAAHAGPPWVKFIGTYDGKQVQSIGRAISDDGKTVVGEANIGGFRAFRWTEETGMVLIDDLPGGGTKSQAWGVSPDGSVVVGLCESSNGSEAFRWSAGTGTVGIGDLPGGAFSSAAIDVSADGSVIVGFGTNANNALEAFRWTARDGMVGLGDLPGGVEYSVAIGVSADGLIVTGYSGSQKSGQDMEAFRWTARTGMKGLGDLSGGQYWSNGYDISRDGTVIVGHSVSGGGMEAFRWADGTGMVGLGDLPGGLFQSSAYSCSAGGEVVVGNGSTADSSAVAFFWTQATAMVNLREWLISQNVKNLTGRDMSVATSVSANGLFITGQIQNPSEPFIAFLGSPPCYADCDGSGELDIDDFICFQTLFATGSFDADCDGDKHIDIDDFICFQTAFGAGCG